MDIDEFRRLIRHSKKLDQPQKLAALSLSDERLMRILEGIEGGKSPAQIDAPYLIVLGLRSTIERRKYRKQVRERNGDRPSEGDAIDPYPCRTEIPDGHFDFLDNLGEIDDIEGEV